MVEVGARARRWLDSLRGFRAAPGQAAEGSRRAADDPVAPATTPAVAGPGSPLERVQRFCAELPERYRRKEQVFGALADVIRRRAVLFADDHEEFRSWFREAFGLSLEHGTVRAALSDREALGGAVRTVGERYAQLEGLVGETRMFLWVRAAVHRACWSAREAHERELVELARLDRRPAAADGAEPDAVAELCGRIRATCEEYLARTVLHLPPGDGDGAGAAGERRRGAR